MTAQVLEWVLEMAAAMQVVILRQTLLFLHVLLRSRQPNYPSSARSASIEGTTTVRILVGYEVRLNPLLLQNLPVMPL